MKQKSRLGLLVLPAVLLAAVAVQAAPPPGKGPNKGADVVYDGDQPGNGQGKGQGKHNQNQQSDSKAAKNNHGKHAARQTDGATLVRAGISIGDARALVTDLHIDRGQYKALPPGIAKNLARGKPLPPGIAKQYVPGPMLARLPSHPGYEWRVAGTSLALVYSSSGVVADVLVNIF